MNDTQKNSQDNLDRKLSILKDLMKKENEMLRKMISSLDSLEKGDDFIPEKANEQR